MTTAAPWPPYHAHKLGQISYDPNGPVDDQYAQEIGRSSHNKHLRPDVVTGSNNVLDTFSMRTLYFFLEHCWVTYNLFITLHIIRFLSQAF